jgi:threonyl-tRNA synthetase
MLVIGDKEAAAGTVAPRSRSGGATGAVTLDAFIEQLKVESQVGGRP